MIGLPNPYVALGGVGLLIAATTGAFFEGKHVAKGEVAQEKLTALTDAIADVKGKQTEIDHLVAVGAARENTRQDAVREVYREIPTIVHDPVYRNICVSDGGVRLLDRATTAANGLNPGEPTGGPAAVPDHAADNRPAGKDDHQR